MHINPNDNQMARTTSYPLLKDEIEKAARYMQAEGKDECEVSIPDTNVKFVLVKEDSAAEEGRKSDKAAFTGAKYEVNKEMFLLARR